MRIKVYMSQNILIEQVARLHLMKIGRTRCFDRQPISYIGVEKSGHTNPIITDIDYRFHYISNKKIHPRHSVVADVFYTEIDSYW